ncbi:MAG: radical SAM family heme chaperone HemW [bacterium]|nr:radical SAM family heme chaperone HemW [bacterium]
MKKQYQKDNNINSVYIHIPFCKKICSYCDFCKIFYNEKLVNDYLESLQYEVLNNYNGQKLKTIYIGGGTPSSLKIEQLNKLFSITNKLNLCEKYEFTIEANVSDINDDFLKICRLNGINRLSIGVETINKKFYKLLNRHNDKNDIIEKIKLCKKYFCNINIDLMYGFPDEDMDDLKKDLDFLKDLDVSHVSIYSLIIEKNTKLFIDNVENIDEETEYNMYYYIIDFLNSIGYSHYEISNFCKNGKESLHNLNYWNNNYYYGFGLGAAGYVDNVRYSNTRSINNYIKHNYIFDKEILDKEIIMSEEMICGLRKIVGVSKKDFNEKFNIDIRDVFNIDDLIKKGLLEENSNYIYIPKDKLYIQNSILINFIK